MDAKYSRVHHGLGSNLFAGPKIQIRHPPICDVPGTVKNGLPVEPTRKNSSSKRIVHRHHKSMPTIPSFQTTLGVVINDKDKQSPRATNITYNNHNNYIHLHASLRLNGSSSSLSGVSSHRLVLHRRQLEQDLHHPHLLPVAVGLHIPCKYRNESSARKNPHI